MSNLKRYGIETTHSLRWCFAYYGRKDKIGMWDKSGEFIPGLNLIDQSVAWCQTKENLDVAYIEIKNLKTREIKKVVTCAGWDFINFDWSAITPMPLSKSNFNEGRQHIITGVIYGLVMVTRDKRVTVLRNGKIEIRDRTASEKTLKYSGFGK